MDTKWNVLKKEREEVRDDTCVNRRKTKKKYRIV